MMLIVLCFPSVVLHYSLYVLSTLSELIILGYSSGNGSRVLVSLSTKCPTKQITCISSYNPLTVVLTNLSINARLAMTSDTALTYCSSRIAPVRDINDNT